MQTRGAFEREVHVDAGEFDDLRLPYAQHVYNAQRATVPHAFVLTGAWQSDRGQLHRVVVVVVAAGERGE